MGLYILLGDNGQFKFTKGIDLDHIVTLTNSKTNFADNISVTLCIRVSMEIPI